MYFRELFYLVDSKSRNNIPFFLSMEFFPFLQASTKAKTLIN
uniref:Uncharacterized protein n=1 Tax=Lepeophtheirus salmonis TaxID=72036 RepID=A0A0K2V3U2_LEPSM